MVRKVSKPDKNALDENAPDENAPEFAKKGDPYTWYEMGFFTRWDFPDHCRILCIDTPKYLQSELRAALGKQSTLDFKDPFAMLRHLIDQILVLCDISVWRIRHPVRMIEKVSGCVWISSGYMTQS